MSTKGRVSRREYNRWVKWLRDQGYSGPLTGLKPSFEWVKRLVKELKSRTIPETRPRDPRTVVSNLERHTRGRRHAEEVKEEARPSLDSELAQRLASVCQKRFAELTLTSLLRPFATTSDPWAKSIYDREIRHHLGHSVLVTKISSSIKSSAEFSQLKARFSDHEVWSHFDEWENDADALVDAFQQWYSNMWNSVKRGVLACYGEPPRSDDDVFDYFTQLVNMAKEGDMKGAETRFLKLIDRPAFQQFNTVWTACGMLSVGISELPPNPYWAHELDELARIEKTARSATPPIPKDFASQMDVGEFPDQVDETKNLVAIADRLRQTQALIIKGLQQLAPV